MKNQTREARASRAQEVALASELCDSASQVPRVGSGRLEAGGLNRVVTSTLDVNTEAEDDEGVPPVKRVYRGATVPAVKKRLVEQLDGGGDSELICLHIAANVSADAFNELTAKQLEANSAQMIVVNAHCEVELDLACQAMQARQDEVMIARDRLVLDSKIAKDQKGFQQEQLGLTRIRQSTSIKMAGQIDTLNRGFVKLEGTMEKVESFLKDLVNRGG